MVETPRSKPPAKDCGCPRRGALGGNIAARPAASEYVANDRTEARISRQRHYWFGLPGRHSAFKLRAGCLEHVYRLPGTYGRHIEIVSVAARPQQRRRAGQMFAESRLGRSEYENQYLPVYRSPRPHLEELLRNSESEPAL